jgi:polyisoprenoid-binding protein YceI
MKRLTIFAVAVLMIAASSISAQTKWSVDKAHSSVKFSVVHMVVSEVDGNFKMFDGSLESAKADFSDAKVNFTIDVNSINTDNERREGHLKSADFFDVEVYPSIKFVSTSMKPLGGNKYELAGNLTLKDVTKPVVFQVTYGGTLTTKNGTKAGFKAKTTIDRYDYNLKWNNALEAGGLAVSKEVEITVNVELNKN